MTSSCNYLDDAKERIKKINQLSATLESFFFSYEKYNFKRKSYDPDSLAAADQETRCA